MRADRGRYSGILGRPEKSSGRPRICSQWPAVAENYRLSLAPILVVNLRSIFHGNLVIG